jgi:hypothetical protein
MFKYQLQEQEDCFVIQGNRENIFWLVEVVFEKSEKEYAETFVRILNNEAERVYDDTKFNLKKAYYDGTGKFFDFK